ncbi:MAG: glucosaminidase domain-containing protein [Kouleothrix sp.]|nr:glucosaminidase domain-containing protein [Kouleothrix sp.]
MSFQSAPRISQRSFARILVRAQSPAAADGPRLYDLVASYGLDPAIALAFFAHESSYGRRGVAARSLNWGNLRRGPRAYAIRGGFGYYHSWADSLQDWCELILNRYARRGLTTVETAIPVYAPSSDHNAPQRYIAAVRALVEQWMREACAADLGPVSKVVAVTTANVRSSAALGNNVVAKKHRGDVVTGLVVEGASVEGDTRWLQIAADRYMHLSVLR